MFRFILALAAMLAAGFAFPARAADTPNPNRRPARYLIIIETSSSMRRLYDGTQRAVSQLLSSGINGELKSGDTIGVWTFNDDLYTGQLPLQTWTPEAAATVTTNIMKFVRAQRYEKDGHIEKVLSAVARLVQSSEKLTVLIFSGSETKFSGTPFDESINKSFAGGSNDVRKQRSPFVTVLRSQRGKFLGYTVAWSPWPVEFPKFQPDPKPEPPPAEIAHSRKQESNAAPAHTAQSLIVVGNKRVDKVPEANVSPTPTPIETKIHATEQPTETPKAEPVQSIPPTPAMIAPEAQPQKAPEKSVENLPQDSREPDLPETSAPAIKPDAASAQNQSAPAVETAVATPAADGGSGLLLIGLAALVAALGLGLFFIRRPRPAKGSLITRSMEEKE